MKLGHLPIQYYWKDKPVPEGLVPVSRLPSEDLEKKFVGFGIFDKKGREFGAFKWIQIRKFAAGEMAPGSYSTLMAKPEVIGAEFFEVIAQAARAGKAHGSSGSTYFTTLAEAEKQAQAYLAKSKKTAIKKHLAGA